MPSALVASWPDTALFVTSTGSVVPVNATASNAARGDTERLPHSGGLAGASGGSPRVGIDLSIQHTIDGALMDRACMFSFVPLPGGEFAGAYRAGSCDKSGDGVVAFRAAGLGTAAGPQDVRWISQEPIDRGEDPRCFLWRGRPACLTWTELNGQFRLLLFESGGARAVQLDRTVTSAVGGKNWVAVPARDGQLYLVASLQPLRVLKYEGESNGTGKLSWHHSDSGTSSFIWRGGSPAAFFETGGTQGYVGLGHHTDSKSRHEVMAYVFDPDLRRVEFLNTDKFLLPRNGPTGVWDPLSLWQAGVQNDTGLPQFGAVVTYWNNMNHDWQRTHLVSFAVFAVRNTPISLAMG